MIETVWQVFYWNGSHYVADGSIPAPNSEFEDKVNSTKKTIALVDGSECLAGPEVKFLREQITFSWQFRSKNELKARLMNYVRNNTRVKLVCKLDGEAYDGDFFNDGSAIEGEFLNISAKWVIGLDSDTQFYNLTATFKPKNLY